MQRYKRYLSVDFGSTNSQVAVRYEYCDVPDDTPSDKQTWISCGEPEYFKDAGEPDIPTVLIKRDDLNDTQRQYFGFANNPKVGVIGHEALNKINAAHIIDTPPVHSEFKRNLYIPREELDADPEKKKAYAQAVDDMGLFLKLLKKNYVADKYANCITETRISYPLCATQTQRDTLKRLALEAGFENVSLQDETAGILNYALYRKNSELRKKLGTLKAGEFLYVLIVDIGGSSTDILLFKVGPDGNGGYASEQINAWPLGGESDTLGGIDIDKSLCRWFLSQGYLLEDNTRKDIERCGYIRFRIFKQEASAMLQVQNTVRDYGCLYKLTSDKKNSVAVRFDSPEGRHIDRTLWLEEIFREYGEKLQDAIRETLKNGVHEVREEDISCVVLSGGGSLIYGVKDLFMGTAGTADPLSFPAIKNDPSMLVTSEIPSGLCALGNVLPRADIPYKKIVPRKYWFRIRVYETDTTAKKGWLRILDTEPDVPAGFSLLRHRTWIIAEKGDSLPLKCEVDLPAEANASIPLKINNTKAVVAVFLLYSSQNDKLRFEYGWAVNSSRTPARMVRGLIPLLAGSQDSNLRFKMNAYIDENLGIRFAPELKVTGYITWGPANYQAMLNEKNNIKREDV